MFITEVMPPQFVVMLLGAVPFFELRGALPIGVTIYEMPYWEAMLWSILGNIIPFFLALLFFEKSAAYLSARSPRIKKWIKKTLERIRLSMRKEVKLFGPLALAIAIIIPLPITGTVSAALASFVFKIPKLHAFLAALSGLMVSATIVAILTSGAISIFDSWVL